MMENKQRYRTRCAVDVLSCGKHMDEKIMLPVLAEIRQRLLIGLH